MTLLPTPAAEICTQTLAKGETLFRQGDATVAVFAVQTGRICLLRHLADGHTVPLHVARAGETFSEAALFSPVYHCDAVAEQDTVVEKHPKRALLSALGDDDAAARAFMAHLAGQVIQLRSRLETRNIRSAPARVLHFLRLQADEATRTITFDRTLMEVAADIGLTHEAFYRALARLDRDGVISRQGRCIILRD